MIEFQEPNLIEKYLRLFLNEFTLFNILIDKYPEIKEDLYSARENPKCECMKRVISFLNEKIKNTEDLNFIESLINKNDPNIIKIKSQIDDTILKQKEEHKKFLERRTASMNIYKIKKDDQSWKDFHQFVEKNVLYKNCFLLEKEDYFEIRFL